MNNLAGLAKKVLGYVNDNWLGSATVYDSKQSYLDPRGTPKTVQAQPQQSNQPAQSSDQIEFGGQYPNAEQQLSKFYQSVGNPPMAQYQSDIIAAARKYGIDPRVLPLIAQNESSGGQNYPQDSFNPFGYLGGDGQTVNEKLHAGFTSLPMAIDRLSNRFANKYPALKQNPSFDNLQAVYNANPNEALTYRENINKLLPLFQ